MTMRGSNGKMDWPLMLRTLLPVIILMAVVLMWITDRVETPEAKQERIDTTVEIHDGVAKAHPMLQKAVEHNESDYRELRDEIRDGFREVKAMIREAHE